MKKRQLIALSLLAGLLLAPMAASADNHEMAPKPLTWLSYIQSQPGKSMPLSQHLAQNGAKVYDGLMADGHIITWGVGMSVNHFPGDEWNILEWVTFRDWAAVDTFMQKFMGMQMSKSPEEMMAEQETWLSLIVPGSHWDRIVRHQVVVPREGPPPAYFTLTSVPVNPGQSEALQEIWVENVQPTMAKLQADGKVGAFGLAADEVHDGSGFNSLFWTALPNLAARDAITAAMDADAKARGEEAQKEMMKAFGAATDFPAHTDRIVMVVHNGGGGSAEGDGDGDSEGGE